MFIVAATLTDVSVQLNKGNTLNTSQPPKRYGGGEGGPGPATRLSEEVHSVGVRRRPHSRLFAYIYFIYIFIYIYI